MIKKISERLFANDFEIPVYLGVNNIPSLDGLRAISIIWVVLGHVQFSQNIPPLLHQVLTAVFGGGQLGVKLFFVISGFLITTLLIKEKIKTKTVNLKKFYVRRLLRIFPVFYLYLFVLFVLNGYLHMGIEQLAFAGAALYLTNFYIFPTNWSMVHSWSLAVEEQYYLLWPAVFRKNTRLAFIVAVSFICIAPPLRVFVYYYPRFTNLLLAPFIDGADSIFIGSLLALGCFKGIINWSFFAKYKLVVSVAGFFIMWFISNSLLNARYGKIMLPFGTTVTAAAFCCIIISNIVPAKDILFKVLNSRVFVLIGRLSYSIYVWQQLFLLAPVAFPSASFTWNRLPVNLLFIGIISSASYYWFEKYFLNLKSKFKV